MTADAPESRHWVVVGLMGSGKTTVGELLADRVGRPFVDNDVQLRALTGSTARAIEADRGIDALHDLERQALLHAIEATTPAVIAAAASIVDDSTVREHLHRDAFVIWLAVDADELARRIGSQSHRPLAADAAPQLRQQAAARSALFAELADVVVDATQWPNDIVDEVMAHLNRRS